MGIKPNKIFYFFALAVAGKGISGGDRIFIEFARRWSRVGYINLFTSYEGTRLLKSQNLSGKNIRINSINNRKFLGSFLFNYLYKIISGVRLGFSLRLPKEENIYLYSVSEFWMDSLPVIILKLRYPKVSWIAAWYETAPNPLIGYREGERKESYRLSAFYFWLMQLPIKPAISSFADFVLINNEEEKKQFPKHNTRGKAIVVLGAVDLEKIGKWKKAHAKFAKKYDAVFQGRFHPQKGVVELIEIWRKVVNRKPSAKLAMIGDGPLMRNVKLKIKNLKLERNIELFGYVFDGSQKYKIFSQSKIVVHPAFFDSGGMAAAEAMAFGLPCVGFNLKSFKSYYPQGMVKVEIGDLKAFAGEIVRLLDDTSYYQKIAQEALEMIQSNWSWEKRAKDIFAFVSFKFII